MARKVSIILLGVSCLLALVAAQDNDDEWSTYKAKYGKIYESRVEESMRRSIFVRNKQVVEQHNGAADASYTLELNHLADRTEAELGHLNGFKVSHEEVNMLQNSPAGEQFLIQLMGNRSNPLPAEVDWRNVPGVVSAVKDQMYCGSCWAFSTTGLLEGQQLKVTKGKKLISLSEQNLVDCAKENGCSGDWPTQALYSIFYSGGIDSEQFYPYDSKEHACKFNVTSKVMTTRGPVVLPQDEEFLKAVVAKYGPVSVAIDANDLQLYSEGIYGQLSCGNKIRNLDHAVLVVGYGTDTVKDGDYWIVKNSWGDDWGEKGYFKLARNRDNMCGVATMAVIAAFDKYTF